MPPKAAKKPKKEKKPKAEGKGGKKKKRRTESYSIYIYKVLKQVHPDTGISTKGMSIMNSFISDIFDKIANEAGKLVRYSRHPHVARDPDRVWTVQDHFSFIKKIKINFKGYI